MEWTWLDARAMSLPPNYREFAPGPFLAGVVECFWTSAVDATLQRPWPQRVLPDGCMDVLFDFAATGSQRATVVGTMTQPLVTTLSIPVDLLGVRFRPGGLSGFCRFDAAELVDVIAELTHFWGGQAEQVWQQLGETAPEERLRVLQEILRDRIDGHPQADPFLQRCVTRIEDSSGGARIADLEKDTGLSTRQLERKFAQHLGISPKTFARIVRFKRVVAAAANPDSLDWVRLAGDLGYADQSHLVREFRAFSGQSPSAHVNRAYRRNVGFLQDALGALG